MCEALFCVCDNSLVPKTYGEQTLIEDLLSYETMGV